jgi:hypothetical protein
MLHEKIERWLNMGFFCGFDALVRLSFAWFKDFMKKFIKTFFIIIILSIVFVFAKYLGQFMI